jgi:hypothetical protein
MLFFWIHIEKVNTGNVVFMIWIKKVNITIEKVNTTRL